MKYFFLPWVLCIALSLPIISDVDSQIEAIQKASVSERFKLMNAFKREIVQMKETERIEALTKLRSINSSKHANAALREITRHKPRRYSKHHNDTLERIKDNDAQESTTNQTENNIENETSNETENNVENETSNETDNSVENETSNETEDNIETQTQEHVENETEDRHEEEHNDD